MCAHSLFRLKGGRQGLKANGKAFEATQKKEKKKKKNGAMKKQCPPQSKEKGKKEQVPSANPENKKGCWKKRFVSGTKSVRQKARGGNSKMHDGGKKSLKEKKMVGKKLFQRGEDFGGGEEQRGIGWGRGRKTMAAED